MSNEPRNELLTLPAMARALRVTQRWLRREVEAGRLPAVNADSRFLFSRLAVERALLERADCMEAASCR
ncbi:MAG: helix-turn-helix domain-containing protein [Pirellulales bacterium]|nr:helix-turn-helix domain-containing protein [Pirellulales bacterium]